MYMNSTCEHVWGKTLATCLGKGNHELWPAGLADQLTASDTAALDRGETSQQVEELPLTDGCTVHLLSFRFPFIGAVTGGGCSVLCPSILVSKCVPNERYLVQSLPRRCCFVNCTIA